MTVEKEADPGSAGPGPDRRPAAADPEDPRPSRLPHEPALDGLRGLAVAVVVLFHLGRLDGGFLGVDLFLVLSGFLITSLLIADWHTTEGIGLRRFWARRARRLLPGVALLLVGVAVLLLQFTAVTQRAGFRDDALATLGYVANWQRMSADIGYWDMFSQPSPLDHMWSLAIEEQFYVVWPIVVLLALGWRRRGSLESRLRWLTLVAAGGAVVSLGLLAATYVRGDTNRAYFATDTRIGPSLLGAALAAVVARRPRPSSPPGAGLELVGLLGLAWMTWSVGAVDGIHPWYYRGGLALFALAALVVIRTVTGGPAGSLARMLSWAPLRGLGAISYGVYLWHWPVIVYTTPERTRLDGARLDLLRVALTLVAALVSYTLVEQPIRRGAMRGWRIRLATVGTATACLAAVLVATTGTTSSDQVIAGEGDPRGRLEGRDQTTLFFPADVADSTPKVLLLGDSGTQFLGPALRAEGQPLGVAVAFSSQPHCSILFAGEDGLVMPHESLWDRPVCTEDRVELWTELVDQFDPDVILYYLANAGGLIKEQLDGQWVWDCDRPYDEFLQDALLDEVELLGNRGDGANVVIATSPYVGFLDGTSRARVDCRNDTYRRVAAESPVARVVDLNGFVEREGSQSSEAMLADQMHLSETGAAWTAHWLLASQLTELREPTSD